jgi:uncharacterized protein (TIGR00661 family)
LEENNFNPIIASDGQALELLKKEFPHLMALELPSYEIEYPKNGKNLKWKLLQNSLKTLKAIRTEKKIIQKWIGDFDLKGIISDNRLGVVSKRIPSVYITHQLKVLSGNTTWLSTKIHQLYLKNFTECWVPDTSQSQNLSGELGHLSNTKFNIKYIGILSRFKKKQLPIKYNVMVLLSGPEPQRTMLEEKLLYELQNYSGKVVFIKGSIERTQKSEIKNHIHFYNFMTTNELEYTFSESEIVICRSGYSSIMDLVQLEKKAFLIPTPGQFEQEYLAKKMESQKMYPFAKQEKFSSNDIQKAHDYKPFKYENEAPNWSELLSLF